MPTSVLPSQIRDVAHLEELLSEPSPGALESMRQLQGDLLLLGVGGKMGPTLARMAKRACALVGRKGKVIGVARFSDPKVEQELQAHGVETIRADLLDRAQVAQLPDAENVLFMTGMKFGASEQAGRTWAMNTYVPALVCERYRDSRLVAFSTGNVYGLAPVGWGGSLETDALAPVGEYAFSALGRERIFEYFSRQQRQPCALLRLNYACEMRYGVLVDIAQQVWSGQPISLAMGQLNALWQADANAYALQAFQHLNTPPTVVNLAGPELLSVRRIAQTFGELLGKPVQFVGQEGSDALLSNGQLGHQWFGYPRVGAQQMCVWIADWLKRGGVTLGKPTHFEARAGKF